MPAPTIAELNDKFRASLGLDPVFRHAPGNVVLTPEVTELPWSKIQALLARVAAYDDFGTHNDPHAEHDFGWIEFEGHGTFFWEIDYYAPGMNAGAVDPADVRSTVRVLTVMHSSEYLSMVVLRKTIVGAILTELDRQRDQEPVFPLPYIGEIDDRGLMRLEGTFNIHQLAAAVEHLLHE